MAGATRRAGVLIPPSTAREPRRVRFCDQHQRRLNTAPSNVLNGRNANVRRQPALAPPQLCDSPIRPPKRLHVSSEDQQQPSPPPPPQQQPQQLQPPPPPPRAPLSSSSRMTQAAAPGSLFEAAGVGPGGGNPAAVKAIVRVRPFSAKEARNGAIAAVKTVDDQSLKVDGVGLAHGSLSFGFDRVAGPAVGQDDFWATCGVQQMLDAAMDGYGATIFAYGQTGSGKTHTMLGPEGGSAGVDGLIPRAIEYLYDSTYEHSAVNPHVRYTLRGSFYEIYNEQVYDLLNPQPAATADGTAIPVNLPVRWNASTQSFFVEDLFVVACDSAEDMTAVVSEGTANRRTGNHAMNKDSSRSHSVFTIEIDTDAGDGTPVRKGKVCLVDLAGSERQRHTGSTGQVFQEATSINSSLLTLGKVISALSAAVTEPNTQAPKPPFRDSKLTKVLKDSLGGQSLALMIACVSPAATYADESVSTLWYASRAKNIVNRPSVRHDDPKDQQIAALQAEVEGLRRENGLLKHACASAGIVVHGPDGSDLAAGGGGGGGGDVGRDGTFLPHIAGGGGGGGGGDGGGRGWRSASPTRASMEGGGAAGGQQQLATLQAEIARLGAELASVRAEKEAAENAQWELANQLHVSHQTRSQMESLGPAVNGLHSQNRVLKGQALGLRRSLQNAHSMLLNQNGKARLGVNPSKEAREVQQLRRSHEQMRRRLSQQQKQQQQEQPAEAGGAVGGGQPQLQQQQQQQPQAHSRHVRQQPFQPPQQAQPVAAAPATGGGQW
jgi:uncharacterized small protein (DUF1192 family)